MPNPSKFRVTTTQTFNYEIGLIENIYGCTVTPNTVRGTIVVTADDMISHRGTSGAEIQTICVNSTPSPTFALDPIEYELDGATGAYTEISVDGGTTWTPGLPRIELEFNGIQYNVNFWCCNSKCHYRS